MLNNSTGTVSGVFSGSKRDGLDSKCLSISSEVRCPPLTLPNDKIDKGSDFIVRIGNSLLICWLKDEQLNIGSVNELAVNVDEYDDIVDAPEAIVDNVDWGTMEDAKDRDKCGWGGGVIDFEIDVEENVKSEVEDALDG